MISAVTFGLIAAALSLLSIFGIYVLGLKFVFGWLLGVACLAFAAATSDWLRGWFAAADEQIDDERFASEVQRRAGKVGEAITIRVRKEGSA